MLCRRITVHRERVDIEISGRGLRAFLQRMPTEAAAAVEPDHPLLLSFPTRLCRIGQGKRLVIDAAPKPGMPGRPDPKLIKLLLRAHHLKEKLLRLTFLAPDITRAILEGRQPGSFTAQKLVTYSALPFAWPEQRQALGFA